MSPSAPVSMAKPLIFAGLLTAAVSGVRLYGELQGWDPRFFSKDPGGAGAWVGISWLIFVFGFWFGARLARHGQAPAPGKTLALHLLAVAILVGTFFTVFSMMGRTADGRPDIQTFPDLQKFVYITIAGGGVAALVALIAWPRLGFTTLIYALLARIPVVVITYLSCKNQWGTHYEGLGPTNLPLEPYTEKAFWLSVPQLTLWPEMTIVFGGLCGAIAACLFRGKAR